jgi:hypothetical protein
MVSDRSTRATFIHAFRRPRNQTGGHPGMTSIFKTTTSAQHRALLQGLAKAGYKVVDASRPNAHCVRVEHRFDQAADVEAKVRAIDPSAERI